MSEEAKHSEEKSMELKTHPVASDPVDSSIAPFEGDYMEVTVDVADYLVKYEKAVDTILHFIIKRTYAGDWVCHDRAGTALEDRTANFIGAAALRIARDLGITESNRTKPTKVMDESHPGHYRYECEADFTFRGRTIHAIGIASTINSFYSKKHGEAVDPKDIREDYVMRDCWGDCVKQGIRSLFGLKRIPLVKLKELGYDISKVKYVNFQQGEKSASAKNPGANAAPAGAEKQKVELLTVTTVFKKHLTKTSGARVWQTFSDSDGVEYSLWRPIEHEDTQRLLTAISNEEQVTIEIKYDGKYRQIQKIIEVVPQ